MENDPVADSYPLANGAWHPRIHVDDGAVLDVRSGADHDGSHVAPKDCVIPDAGVLTDSDVTHNRSRRRDKGGWMDFWHPRVAAVTAA
jgi:hypothetical protein